MFWAIGFFFGGGGRNIYIFIDVCVSFAVCSRYSYQLLSLHHLNLQDGGYVHLQGHATNCLFVQYSLV